MRRLRLLQVGDLHYDDAVAGPPDVDVKDPGFDQKLLTAAAPPKLRAVMQRLQRLCEEDTPDGALFCGDLSSRGLLSVYRDCLAYLEDNLDLSGCRYWPLDHLHSVPGNHDVDRALVVPDNLFAKFVPLTDAWRENSTDVLACDAVRQSYIESSGARVLALSLNSCVGAGEKRGAALSDEVRTELEVRASAGDEAAADALWEDLDMPLFYEEHLANAVDAISGAPRPVLPVVLAHHNLLPQATPRAEIYTELFNAGAARVQLAGLDRWVLYLHGHIHDDPVEIIDQRHPQTGRVLSISAPLFQEGFNVITLEFGKLGRPLGCVITRYRYEKGGVVRPQKQIRVSLRDSRDAPDSLISEIVRLLQPTERLYFHELQERYAAAGGTAGEEDFCDALREADWAGWVEIAQRDDEPQQWRILRESM
jgi:hypothetical protein